MARATRLVFVVLHVDPLTWVGIVHVNSSHTLYV